LNEDRCLVGDWRSDGSNANWRGVLAADHGWAVIADGMGGHEAGDVASRIAVDAVYRVIRQVTCAADIEEMLDGANRDLFAAMHSGVGRPGMGTTIVGARWAAHEVLIFNLGDSRAYWVGPEGLAQVSRDDTLDAHDFRGRARSHVLTQCLGGTSRPTPLQPQVKSLPWVSDASLLVCSDGLTDMLSDDEIAPILAQNADNPAKRLVAATLDAGGHDNVTVVVVGTQDAQRVGWVV
jgi:protein phosphatase